MTSDMFDNVFIRENVRRNGNLIYLMIGSEI